MSNRVLNEAKIKEARRLRQQGWTDSEIGQKLDVSAKTIYRALGSKREAKLKIPDMSPPNDHLWPTDWNADRFRESGMNDESAETHWAIVQGAIHSNNRWIQWHEKSYVELLDELRDDKTLLSSDTGKHWIDALAGLPVLCAWLGGSDACDGIKKTSIKYKPWVARAQARHTAEIKPKGIGKVLRKAAQIDPEVRSRIGYRSAVRPYSEEVIRMINREQLNRAVRAINDTDPQMKVSELSPTFVLNGLLERIPMFDLHPKDSKYAAFGIWEMLTVLFGFESTEVKL